MNNLRQVGLQSISMQEISRIGFPGPENLPGPDPATIPSSSITWVKLLTPYVKKATFFRCPSVKQNLDYEWNSYGYRTLAPFLYSATSPYAAGAQYRHVKLSKISSAYGESESNFWIMADTAWFRTTGAGSNQWYQYYLFPFYDKAWVYFDLRHNGMGNFLFLDGHVEAVNTHRAKELFHGSGYAQIRQP